MGLAATTSTKISAPPASAPNPNAVYFPCESANQTLFKAKKAVFTLLNTTPKNTSTPKVQTPPKLTIVPALQTQKPTLVQTPPADKLPTTPPITPSPKPKITTREELHTYVQSISTEQMLDKEALLVERNNIFARLQEKKKAFEEKQRAEGNPKTVDLMIQSKADDVLKNNNTQLKVSSLIQATQEIPLQTIEKIPPQKQAPTPDAYLPTKTLSSKTTTPQTPPKPANDPSDIGILNKINNRFKELTSSMQNLLKETHLIISTNIFKQERKEVIPQAVEKKDSNSISSFLRKTLDKAMTNMKNKGIH